MNTFCLILLALLIFIASIYTYIGLRFSLVTRKHRGLTPCFILGLFIGVIGGLIILYNLKITKGAFYFDIRFEWWWIVTVVSIFVGGLISLLIYLKVTKK